MPLAGRGVRVQAVILAAGDGERMLPRTQAVPKPLLALRGRPIINHVLDGLFAADVRDAVVVVGYRGDQVRAALADLSPCGMRIRFVDNPSYELGNARSLWCAREAVQGPFVLAMGDHLVEPALTRALLAGADGRCRLAVDRASPRDPRAGDATLARVEHARVADLGKSIRHWNALDTGTFWCTPGVFAAIDRARAHDGELARVFSVLAHEGALDAVDVTGLRWIDIDTPDDLRDAEAMLEADGRFA